MVLKIAIALGIVVATWLGGGSLQHIFSLGFAGVFLALWAATLVSMRIFIWARFGIVAWFIYCVMLFTAYIGGHGFKYVFSDMPSYTLEANIPVQVELMQRGGVNSGDVMVTNLSKDVLEQVKVTCGIIGNDGVRVDREFVGGAYGAYASGASQGFKVIHNSDFMSFRANPATMTCKATTATFRKTVGADVSVRFEQNAQDFRNDFYVTNNGSVAVRNIQIACVTEAGQSRKVNISPAYTNVAGETIIDAGKTVKFTDRAANWDYKSCEITNVLVN
ncbi:hypothetical protein D3C72_267470 [compost metagenome]